MLTTPLNHVRCTLYTSYMSWVYTTLISETKAGVNRAKQDTGYYKTFTFSYKKTKPQEKLNYCHVNISIDHHYIRKNAHVQYNFHLKDFYSLNLSWNTMRTNFHWIMEMSRQTYACTLNWFPECWNTYVHPHWCLHPRRDPYSSWRGNVWKMKNSSFSSHLHLHVAHYHLSIT
jgi:hypothetical protein